ncbi:MAG: DUF86 domain-containing protein [Elusimicrobia bacterium]|nr:DUF86 domain-containing protein [Elusimicrobiota bacterium]
MVDKEIVSAKLAELGRYLAELERLKAFSFEEVSASLQKTWAIEHGLQIAIQVVIDTGNHILAAIGENRIEDYADIIDRLGERNIIPPDFAGSIRDMAGFRNILVHEYVEVDLKMVYQVLQSRLDDFRKFAGYIGSYLKTLGQDGV